jgi:DNA-directed RNA polymerase specialized sigma subunit
MKTTFRDKIFENSDPYDDEKWYPMEQHNCESDIRKKALDFAERLIELMAEKKLDSIDMQIIEIRKKSPMPSIRSVGAMLGISAMTVSRRVLHIKELVTKDL